MLNGIRLRGKERLNYTEILKEGMGLDNNIELLSEDLKRSCKMEVCGHQHSTAWHLEKVY